MWLVGQRERGPSWLHCPFSRQLTWLVPPDAIDGPELLVSRPPFSMSRAPDATCCCWWRLRSRHAAATSTAAPAVQPTAMPAMAPPLSPPLSPPLLLLLLLLTLALAGAAAAPPLALALLLLSSPGHGGSEVTAWPCMLISCGTSGTGPHSPCVQKQRRRAAGFGVGKPPGTANMRPLRLQACTHHGCAAGPAAHLIAGLHL